MSKPRRSDASASAPASSEGAAGATPAGGAPDSKPAGEPDNKVPAEPGTTPGEDVSLVERPSWVGRILDDRYRIDHALGAGGVGAVYRATQLKLERPVAIKILHEGLHPSFTARFEREAMALAALRHPNIVTVTDYGVDHDEDAGGASSQTPFIVMELLEGETLHYRLTHGPLPPERVFTLARDLLRALSFVHEQGLVHRDLKPGNIFLEKLPHDEQRLRLLDFGLAKFIDGSRGHGEIVTRHGDIVGTPAYMPPEQIAGDAVDARTDTYSAGVVLYQMLAGRTPYEGEAVDLLTSHLVAPVPTLVSKRPDVTPRRELEALLARALAKQRDARFQTATEMLAALEAIPQPWFLSRDDTEEMDLAVVPTIPSPRMDSSHAGTQIFQAKPEAESGAKSGTERATQPTSGRGRTVPFALGVFAILIVAAVALFRSAQSPTHAPTLARAPGAETPAEPLARANDEIEAAQPSASPTPIEAPIAAPPATPTDAVPAQETGLVAEIPLAAETPAVVEPEQPARIAAKDPWARAVPRALVGYRKAALAGERGSERTIAALRRYNRDNGTDARGHLVLAQLYRNRNWRADALKQYKLAYERDESVRGAPEMLQGLLQLVARGGAGSAGAARLIQDAYGREAVPALDRAIVALKPQNLPAVLARITAVRDAVSK